MPIAAGILLLGLLAAMLLVAPPAKAAYYKMVACSGNNGAPPFTINTNTVSPQNPTGIFHIWNFCDGEGGDPPGEGSFFRIQEHRSPPDTAGETAYGNFYFDTPAFVHYKTAGGYTREPFQFNDGWRARFWVASACCVAQIMTQGAGLPNSGGQWATTGSFAPHLWPFGELWDFNRFVFELMCVRPSRCDTSGTNAADLNGLVFTLSDDSNSAVGFTNLGSPLMQGQWVRGTQTVSFNVSDLGSGLRWERLRVDNAQHWSFDHGLGCNTSTSQNNGEWARAYQPCPTGGPYGRDIGLNTATLPDGSRTLSACTQDFAQYQGLFGTGSESCAYRTINVDNTPPGAPAGLEVTSSNPARYLDHFGAHWSLPPNAGSPITTIHYNIINAADKVVVPEKTVSGTNLSAAPNIAGPEQAGDYRIRVWLEDAVGFAGPASTAPIPHDVIPPAAPQSISVVAPDKSRAAEAFDVKWRNIVDQGAPINAVHYEVLNAGGGSVVPIQTVSGQNIEAIPNLESPTEGGKYTLRMWLSDGEGNQGASVKVPLAYECVRSAIKAGETLTSGLGEQQAATEVVHEGTGSTVRGALKAVSGTGVATVPVCVFSRVVTDQQRDFLGLAITAPDGSYKFPVAPGASRELIIVHRRDHRELISRSTIQTIVHPTLKARKKVIYNKHVARFYGEIPGPHNDRVVIILQAKVGKGWSAFRRYRTRDDGRFLAIYRFRRTFERRKYVMRAQVRQTVGYPYLQGNSSRLQLLVLPKKPKK